MPEELYSDLVSEIAKMVNLRIRVGQKILERMRNEGGNDWSACLKENRLSFSSRERLFIAAFRIKEVILASGDHVSLARAERLVAVAEEVSRQLHFRPIALLELIQKLRLMFKIETTTPSGSHPSISSAACIVTAPYALP